MLSPPHGRTRAEGEEMINLRLIILAVVVAAFLAGCFTYFVTSPLPRVESGQQLPPTAPGVTASTPSPPAIIVQGRSAENFERAAEVILKRLPDALAYAGADEPPITGHIPLPKRRPIPR